MKVKSLRPWICVIFLALSLSQPAQALIDVPTLRMGLGYSPISFTAGTAFPDDTPLGNFLTLNPMFMWDMPSVRMRIGVSFLTDLGSDYGFVSIAGVGFTALLYPLGLSSSREVRGDFSEVIKTRISPFIQFGITPTKLSITARPAETDPVFPFPGKWPYFAANIVETSFGAGLDYPFARDFIAFLGLHYRLAAWKEAERSDGVISYNGFSIMGGISTNFY
jgi:hypothetical protein